jgi:hypothetical protein
MNQGPGVFSPWEQPQCLDPEKWLVRIGVNPSPPNENRRRAYGNETALRGMTKGVFRHEQACRAIDRGQLNGGPFCLAQIACPGQAVLPGTFPAAKMKARSGLEIVEFPLRPTIITQL